MRQLSRNPKPQKPLKSSMVSSTENRNRQKTSGTLDEMVNGKKNMNVVVAPGEELEEICIQLF